MLNFVIIIGVGLINFWVIGQIIDYWIDSSFTSKILNPDIRYFMRNILRPIVLTLIIFGFGVLTIYWMGVSGIGIKISVLYFMGLTSFACLAGRRATFYESGSVMVVTMALVLYLYNINSRQSTANQEGNNPITKKETNQNARTVDPLIQSHDWKKYPYVGEFNDAGYFYTVGLDDKGKFQIKVIGKFHSLSYGDNGHFSHSIVTDRHGKQHPVQGQPLFTMSPDEIAFMKVIKEDPLVGEYDGKNVFHSYVVDYKNKKQYKVIAGKFHSYRYDETGKTVGSTVINEKGELLPVDGIPHLAFQK